MLRHSSRTPTLNAANSTIFIRQYVLTSIQLESNWNCNRKGHHSQTESVWGVKPLRKWCMWAGWDDWCPREPRQQWWWESYLDVVMYCICGSKPSDKGGGGHPDPEIRGMGRSKKNFSRPFGPQFSPKVRGAGPPGPSHGSTTDL